MKQTNKKTSSVTLAEDRLFLRMRAKITAISTSLVFVVLIVMFAFLSMNEYAAKTAFLNEQLNISIASYIGTNSQSDGSRENASGTILHIFANNNISRIQNLMPSEPKQEWTKNKNIVINNNASYNSVPVSSNEFEDENVKLGINSDFQSSAYIPIIIYKLQNDGKLLLLEGQNASLTEESVSELETQLSSADEGFGVDNTSDLCYVKQKTPKGMMVAFTDMSSVDTYINGVMRLFSMVVLAAILIFGLISWWASLFVVKPIRESWSKQRQFIADASHELKTPVSVIMANCSVLLANNNIDEESRKWTQTTLTEAESMRSLIEDMLYLATSSDISSSTNEKNDLSHEAIRTAIQFEARAFEKQNLIEYSDMEDDLMVNIDKQSLDRVIAILVDNACKYSFSNTKIIMRTYTKKKYAVLEVTDTGARIPADAEESVFDRFFRMDSSRTGTNGYGLGLSMAKDIVTKSNGTISAHTDEQGATTFTVKLPKIQPKREHFHKNNDETE